MGIFDERFEQDAEVNETRFIEKNLFAGKRRWIEEAEKTEQFFSERGTKAEGMEKLHRRFQPILRETFEEATEKYPQLEGQIAVIRTAKMDKDIFMSTGPVLDERGAYAGAMIQINEKWAGNSNFEWRAVGLESDLNWRGERYIGGEGSKGLLYHELGHVMALQINAEDAGLKISERNDTRFEALQKRYDHNSKIISLCYNSMRDLEISPRDLGKEISTYASSDFGECFAEAISRYETTRHPGRLSTEIHDRYVNLVEERSKRKAS